MRFYVQSPRRTENSPQVLAVVIDGGLFLELGYCDGAGLLKY